MINLNTTSALKSKKLGQEEALVLEKVKPQAEVTRAKNQEEVLP